jgi:CHAT domain-containing protein
MCRRIFILLMLLIPLTAQAQNIDPEAARRIETALNALGYQNISIDGSLTQLEQVELVHYYADFGILPEDATLDKQYGTLLSRASRFQLGLGPLVVGTKGWSEYSSTPEGWPGYDSAPASETTIFLPEEWLFSSGRHAIALELMERRLPVGPKFSDPILDSWRSMEGEKAQLWLKSEIARFEGLGTDDALLQKSLVELDLLLRFSLDEPTPSEVRSRAFPILKELSKRYTNSQLPDYSLYPFNLRLLYDFSSAAFYSSCDDEGPLPRQWQELAVEIYGRYNEVRPAAPELLGEAARFIPCADPEVAERIYEWRYASAKTKNDEELAIQIGALSVHHLILGNRLPEARTLFLKLFNEASDAQKMDLVRFSDMISLQLVDVATPFWTRVVDQLREEDVQCTVCSANAINLASLLLRANQSFELIDRIFTETDNLWKGPDFDVNNFYAMLVEQMLNTGEVAAILDRIPVMVDRAVDARNSSAAESLSASGIDGLLALGRFSAAEDKLSDFILIAKLGARDPRVSTWQARLNLASEESVSPGSIYASQIASYLDAICKAPKDSYDVWVVEEPRADREAIYGDPNLVPALIEIDLPNRIASCTTERERLYPAIRMLCYLAAKQNDQVQLDNQMSRWLEDVRPSGFYRDSVILNGTMNCPMGIAEAGRMDYLSGYANGLRPNNSDDGVVLLKLATSQDESLAQMVVGLDRGTDERSVPDAVGAAAGYMLDPKELTRMKWKIDLLPIMSGASIDRYEVAGIKGEALDLAYGFRSLNLNGIALMLLETAESANAEYGLDGASKDVRKLFADAEAANLALLRAGIAADRGDFLTAHELVNPVVEAFLKDVKGGKVGSVEDLGPWARRMRSFAELYLAILASDDALLAKAPSDQVLGAQQLISASDSASTSGRLTARLLAVDPDLVRAYQDALRDWRGILVAATRGLATDGEVATARDSVDLLRQRIVALDPAFGASSTFSIASLGDIRASLRGRKLVVTSALPDRLLVTTVSEDGVEVRVVGISSASLTDAVRRFREAILAEQDVSASGGASLTSALLGLVDGSDLPDEGLVFVLDGPLVGLPLAALPLQIGGRQGYLGAEVPISISPNVGFDLTVRSQEASRGDRFFLGIGNAEYSEASAARVLGFVPKPLRETGTELRFMAAMLGADPKTDLLLGKDATEDVIVGMSDVGELTRYRTIAFATHGYLGSFGNLGEAGLLLSEPPSGGSGKDGVLSVSEIYRLNLDADLIVLSACDTGAVRDGNQGLSDLAKAFIYAGARGLIITHWEIDTHAATEMSKRLASEMKSSPHDSASSHYFRAVRSLLADQAATKFHHPKYWASHFVVGP